MDQSSLKGVQPVKTQQFLDVLPIIELYLKPNF